MPTLYELDSELAETRRKLAAAEMNLALSLKTEQRLREVLQAIHTLVGEATMVNVLKDVP